MPNYGIWQERDLALDAQAADVDREALLGAQQTTLAEHNAEINALAGIFSELQIKPQASVRTGSTNRFQNLDEFGRPLPVKGRGQYIVGFPLWKGGTAEGFDFWTHEQMSVQDFADSLDLMLQGHSLWVRDNMLSPIFYNGAGLTYTDVRQGEDLTVYGLANGDTTLFGRTGAASAIDSHYTFQAAAIDAANNPYPAQYTELTEHPENAGSRIVAFVASDQIAATKLLPGFADANSSIINTVPATGDQTTEPLFAPGLNLPLASSMTYVGVHENTFIVQWSSLPSGYIIHVAVDSSVKPLGRREYERPSMRGLINLGEPMARFPYTQNNYVAALGFGAKNRVAASVIKIAASYAAPTAYPFPLP
jgi:hypothetical protein